MLGLRLAMWELWLGKTPGSLQVDDRVSVHQSTHSFLAVFWQQASVEGIFGTPLISKSWFRGTSLSTPICHDKAVKVLGQNQEWPNLWPRDGLVPKTIGP